MRHIANSQSKQTKKRSQPLLPGGMMGWLQPAVQCACVSEVHTFFDVLVADSLRKPVAAKASSFECRLQHEGCVSQ